MRDFKVIYAIFLLSYLPYCQILSIKQRLVWSNWNIIYEIVIIYFTNFGKFKALYVTSEWHLPNMFLQLWLDYFPLQVHSGSNVLGLTMLTQSFTCYCFCLLVVILVFLCFSLYKCTLVVSTFFVGQFCCMSVAVSFAVYLGNFWEWHF